MKVILQETMEGVGHLGDLIDVKDGFARNYLLPKGKALRASEANRARFETMKVDLEARNLQQRGEAEKEYSHARGQRRGERGGGARFDRLADHRGRPQ